MKKTNMLRARPEDLETLDVQTEIGSAFDYQKPSAI